VGPGRAIDAEVSADDPFDVEAELDDGVVELCGEAAALGAAAAAGSNETRLICRPGFSLGVGAFPAPPSAGWGWPGIIELYERAIVAGAFGAVPGRAQLPAVFIRAGGA
jgi:hypothetical protein